jgi:hypothetical protein
MSIVARASARRIHEYIHVDKRLQLLVGLLAAFVASV